MRFLSSEKLSAHKYKTPEGYLICTDAILARTGKQTYRKNEVFADAEDDSEIEVDRRPEDVFSNETMASFENKPITVEHPSRDVNAENHNELSVGFARDIRRATIDGQDVMIGNLVITDAQTIEEIENGEHCELSCGYDCDIEDENNPVQKNIRGNHIALCERGRAGIARIVDSVKDASTIDSIESDFEDITNMSDAKIVLKRYGIELMKKDDRNYVLSKNGQNYTFYVLSNPNEVRKDLVKAVHKLVDSVKNEKSKPEFEAKGKWLWDEEVYDWYDTGRKMYYEEIKRQHWGDSFKDSERRVYTFEYQEKKTGKTHSFRCTAPDAEEARNQLQEWAAEHDEEPYKILSTNMTYDSTAPADLERIPLEARKEMKEARDKKATLIGIAGQIQDIINRADKIEKDDLRAKAKKILSDLKAQFDIKEADFITVDSITKDAEYFIPEDGREPRGLRSRSEIKQAANQFGLQLDIDDRQGCFVVGNKQKIIAFLRKYYTDRDVNEEISFISDSTKDDSNVDIEKVINVAKSRAFELTRQSKNYLTFRYKGNDRNKDVSEIAKILPNNMSASWDEDSLEIAIRDVVKDSDYSEARRAVEHWKKENKLAEDIIKLLNQKFSQLSAEDRQNAYEEATGTRFALKYFDSLKKFEIHDGSNITIVRAKDLADAMKKVRK